MLRNGSPQRRAATLERITDLFLAGASRFKEDHVQLFDAVLVRLVSEIETKARVDLARRLARVSNAPREVVRYLAHDNDIGVAGMLLEHSTRLSETDLLDIAQSKSQGHLLAISGRASIAERLTAVLVGRGDREVARRVAQNRAARLSHDSLSCLLERAQQDTTLAKAIGLRPDIPAPLLRQLVLRTTEVVRQRLLAEARPETQAEIRRVLAEAPNEISAAPSPRAYSAAQAVVQALHRSGKLDETAIAEFARQRAHDNLVIALALVCSVPIEVVERLLAGDRADPVLILGKSAGWAWPTVKAILMTRPGVERISSHGLDAAYSNFEGLSAKTAQRVTRFWQARPIGQARSA
ncbi:MAG: DUF2336 domain-containing protein [Xanthobacteraceae bacterium]